MTNLTENKIADLNKELEVTELEDRLEMVNVAAAADQRCNGSCKPSVDDQPGQL